MAVIQSGATTDLLTVDPTSKAARATLYDSGGNAFESVANNTARYLAVAAIQDVHVSTPNSSVAAIASGVTWNAAGSGESTLGVAGIQVNTFIDRPHTVTVEQSMDQTNWDTPGVSWDVPANFVMAHTVQATSSYVRVKVKNNGGTTSTVTRIQTALCPIVEALPPSLSSGGNLRCTISAEWQNPRSVTGLYSCSTFRTLGTAASPQYIFTLENPAASTKNVVVRDLTIISDSTALLATVAPQVLCSRPAVLPTGGTALASVPWRSGYVAAGAIARGGTASDGGGATAITVTAGSTIYQQFVDRQVTTVGNIVHPAYPVLPPVGVDLRQQILAPGESILVSTVTAAAATTHFIVNCSWTEYQAL